MQSGAVRWTPTGLCGGEKSIGQLHPIYSGFPSTLDRFTWHVHLDCSAAGHLLNIFAERRDRKVAY